VKRENNAELVCAVPSDERVEVFLQPPQESVSWFYNGTHVIVQKEVRFSLRKRDDGTNIEARAFKRQPAPQGFGLIDTELVADDTFNGLMNVMALAGAKFTPETQFAKLPWYGFEADSVGAEEVEGHTMAVVHVGLVEGGGTAALAGLRNGDIIIGVNGRRFRDYRTMLRHMAKVQAGDTIAFEVFRSGLRSIHQVEVTSRPVG